MDILTARAWPAEPAPPLTAHMRAHLAAQYRQDLNRDNAAVAKLRGAALIVHPASVNGRRLAAALLRRDLTRNALAEMEALA